MAAFAGELLNGIVIGDLEQEVKSKKIELFEASVSKLGGQQAHKHAVHVLLFKAHVESVSARNALRALGATPDQTANSKSTKLNELLSNSTRCIAKEKLALEKIESNAFPARSALSKDLDEYEISFKEISAARVNVEKENFMSMWTK